MALDQTTKQEMSEAMDLGVEAVLGNEQMRKIMRMQLATQLLAQSDVLSASATAQDDRIDMALLAADKLIRRAIT